MLQESDVPEIAGMVGIFWLMPDRQDFFFVSAVTVAEGQPHGDWILSWDDHATLWDQLNESGELDTIPRKYREDYARLPRGRVSFNQKVKLFTVYGGNWMTEEIKRIILDRFRLDPTFTRFDIDAHYKIA